MKDFSGFAKVPKDFAFVIFSLGGLALYNAAKFYNNGFDLIATLALNRTCFIDAVMIVILSKFLVRDDDAKCQHIGKAYRK
ncbi:hypothetical protein HYT92_00690 [Candidatus Pacearchaeota archaeon]|nr:hypothetical protein [Candidatus Pacearchaeota archaeon]